MRLKMQERYKLNREKLTQLKKDWVAGVSLPESAIKRQVSVTTVHKLRASWRQTNDA
jgi:hypothetical protein